MSNLVIPGGRRSLLPGLVVLGAALTSLAGCDRPAADRLLVATTWPASERRRLEAAFQSWVTASHDNLEHRLIRLEWLIVEPGDDLVRLVQRKGPPDVLLGGSLSLRGLAFGDPRHDPISLAWALERLGAGDWREGYARLVRAAASLDRIGQPAGRAGQDRERTAAQRAETAPDASFPPRRIEYLAIPTSARNQDLAKGFLRFLAEKEGVVEAPPQAGTGAGVDPDLDSLVADLLGATLVDAQDELWAAWRSLERAGYPDQALKWLAEPPPWPPASVAKYLGRDGATAMSLVDTLAAELVPEPPARAWLIRSWLSPPRVVDETLLNEVAHADDGRLGREPRFRAWLREEWIAWARQRYRRVSRVASTDAGPASK